MAAITVLHCTAHSTVPCHLSLPKYREFRDDPPKISFGRFFTVSFLNFAALTRVARARQLVSEQRSFSLYLCFVSVVPGSPLKINKTTAHLAALLPVLAVPYPNLWILVVAGIYRDNCGAMTSSSSQGIHLSSSDTLTYCGRLSPFFMSSSRHMVVRDTQYMPGADILVYSSRYWRHQILPRSRHPGPLQGCRREVDCTLSRSAARMNEIISTASPSRDANQRPLPG